MAITILIFTLNEEIHLPSCLASLLWCDDVIVVDSFSTDKTKSITEQYGAKYIPHLFTNMWEQRNWALEHADTKYDWVFIMDADERVSDALARELQSLTEASSQGIGAYRVKRRFHMWRKWLRYSSLYPTWLVRLLHKDKVRFISQGHGEGQDVKGEIGSLEHDLIDENLKGIDAWFERQNYYSTKDAAHELFLERSMSKHYFIGVLSLDPMIRRQSLKRMAMNIPGRAFIFFLYSYFLRRGFMDGKEGMLFCIMKSLYQQMVVVKKFDMKVLEKRRDKN